jgi:AraC family transcriptional regulator
VWERPADFHGGRLAILAAHLYQEFREQGLATPLAMEGLVLEMLAEAARSSRPRSEPELPHWLRQATSLLHDRFSENLSLADIAAAVAIHPIHLVRTFRRFHRSTVGEYLRRLRVDFASRQLATTDTPLAAVALASGFADQSHFTKAFKRVTGLTPARYRAVYRDAQPRQRR